MAKYRDRSDRFAARGSLREITKSDFGDLMELADSGHDFGDGVSAVGMRGAGNTRSKGRRVVVTEIVQGDKGGKVEVSRYATPEEQRAARERQIQQQLVDQKRPANVTHVNGLPIDPQVG